MSVKSKVKIIKATATASAMVEHTQTSLEAFLKAEGPVLLYLALIKGDLQALKTLHHSLEVLLMLQDVDTRKDMIEFLRKGA